jgi:hypothetical protein
VAPKDWQGTGGAPPIAAKTKSVSDNMEVVGRAPVCPARMVTS